MSNIFLVNTVDDPYCADNTVAVCTSLDEAKKLFPKKLWRQVSHREGDRSLPFSDPLWSNEYVYECVNCGERMSTHDDLERPSPYVEEVPLNTRFCNDADDLTV